MRIFRAVDKIGKTAGYVLCFSVSFLVQVSLLGMFVDLKALKKYTVFGLFYVYEIVFVLTSLVFVLNFVRFSTPWGMSPKGEEKNGSQNNNQEE